MGQHTWFVKDRAVYDALDKLYEIEDKYDNGEIQLSYVELVDLQHQQDKLYKINDAGYHDLFRTSKRMDDGVYIDDVIYSEQECDKWLSDNAGTIYNYDEEDEQLLNEFWRRFPNGVIYFG